MERYCTVCGGNGHNQRTCSEKGKSIKLFGVEITATDGGAMSKKDSMERRIKKGNPWTEDEQIAFLKGLDFHGKGNWAKIAKDFVPSRTSTQVASHAQKYFMRLLDANERKYRKKSSVFDLRLDQLEETHDHAIVPLGNNQESVQENHNNVSNYYLMKRVLPLNWVYMYPYYHHDASTSASAATKPVSGISYSSSKENNLELTL
ncbi:hypothetical protein RDI58_026777 [Solanum bulbocastanum]|uniref:Uncharacterized protein n=1 Tax=Solanum bulbocastanum TaxID=147425 RepID=A0AAN8T262_SOLBU